MDVFQVGDGDAGVDLGGGKGFVAQQFLYNPDIGFVFQHYRGAGVAEGVRMDVL